MSPLLAGTGRAANDSLRAVLDTVFSAPAYRWVERPNPLAILGRWWRQLVDWLGLMQAGHPSLFWALFWILIGVLTLIVLHAGWVMLQTVRAASAPAAAVGGRGLAEVRGAAWYRREAERLASAGRFPEAMQADFVALVLDLDARKVVRFHPSKTPNEYTYEAALRGAPLEGFRGLVRALYAYAFARVPCGPDEFAAWRAQAAPERYAATR